MARAESRQHGLRTTEGTDDVEKSLELLDKVLSEFEEPEISPPGEPESPSQGHQSEDDGYMSMNGRRAKFVPDFQPTDEQPDGGSTTIRAPPDATKQTTSSQSELSTTPEEQKLSSPPTPEEAEKIISNLLPRISPLHKTTNGNCKEKIDKKRISLDMILSNGDSNASSLVSNSVPEQTTLPKARLISNTTKYGSLPSNSPPRMFGQQTSGDSGIGGPEECTMGSNGGRNMLGMGISAVHDAVLRGFAKLPEPILNEHPVTIYPGRTSPSRRVPPRTLPGSIERHREVCRQNASPTDSKSNSESSSHSSPDKQSRYFLNTQEIHLVSFNHHRRSDNSAAVTEGGNNKGPKVDSDEDRFSEDSLEEMSLPPPAATTIVPPPPSLSAPVTPSKRHSIAWEINLDDPIASNLGDSKQVPGSTRINGRKRGKSASGSQSSLTSTLGHSNTSNRKTGSSEWPDPPDIPICSTEDEAASIYSDSDDLQIPNFKDIQGREGGTYVIRKGKKQRQRLDIVDDSMSSLNSRLSNEGSFSITSSNVPSPVFPASMHIPNSRHSIDLGTSTGQRFLHHHHHHHQQAAPASLMSPRSRLSLDLNSPTSELPTINKVNVLVASPNSLQKSNTTTSITIRNSPNNPQNNNNNAINSGTTQQNGSSSNFINNNNNNNNSMVSMSSSPRYTEFKTYSSTFDGLQALESSNNNINRVTLNAAAPVPTSPTSISVTKIPSAMTNNVSTTILNVSPENPGLRTLPALGDTSTPRRELAPPIEEDEEVDSDTQRGAPLREIENNISALLRGDMALPQLNEQGPVRRPIGFRLGVHKSESAKEMMLQQPFGPLPATPPESSSPEVDSDEFPPLPPSPAENDPELVHGMHGIRISSRGRLNSYRDDAPSVPPHAQRGPSINTLKTRSMDAGFSNKYRNGSYSAQPQQPGTLPPDLPGSNSRRRVIPSGYPRRQTHSPREERRLQTSASLPETPIFARGCDIPRTPHRRQAPEIPTNSVSRTTPRSNTLNSSVIGIGASALGGGINGSIGGSSGRQRNINAALANGEILRLAGGPARGWYPKQRNTRPASTENLDRLHHLHPQGSLRAWEAGSGATGTGSRKPLTLPPNLTPKFFNSKSPRDALRRVTSLLIRKGNGVKEKEPKTKVLSVAEQHNMMYHRSATVADESLKRAPQQPPPPPPQKKKGFFRNFWKKSRHYSLEQQ